MLKRSVPGEAKRWTRRAGHRQLLEPLGGSASARGGKCAVARLARATATGEREPGTERDNNAAVSGSRKELTVAVDVDEVLGRFVESLAEYVKEAENIDTEVGDYFVYRFAKVWNTTEEESARIVHDFFGSERFQQGIATVPGAREVLSRLRPWCRLVVVTSRQLAIEAQTREWLDSNFPEVFEEVHFGNHFALQGYPPKPKPQLCLEAGADVLVDDSPEYAVECAEAGMDVVLFDWHFSYPWSKGGKGLPHPRVHRAPTWDSVERVIMSIRSRRHG